MRSVRVVTAVFVAVIAMLLVSVTAADAQGPYGIGLNYSLLTREEI
jgi:hypothetical protein